MTSGALSRWCMVARSMQAIALSVLCLSGPALAAEEVPFVFETWSKQRIEAFRGELQVPENRRAEGGRTIPLTYLRLPATGNAAGPPIVYLAGGPGGSGIQAINYRHRMFMAMRQYGDVIALDQRGTGASNILPECRSGQTVPIDRETTDREFAVRQRRALRECLAFWRRGGVDLAGYNTVQNAHDLDALRRHLGTETIVLWGTSYGSHLALAALRELEGRIAKVVVSSVEGLDQTIKLPARMDGYLDRLQAAIDSQPDAKAAYPDIKALMRRVHARLEREPVRVTLKSGEGAQTDYLLQRRDMQLIASGMVADPKGAAQLLNLYLALDLGRAPRFERIPARLLPDALADPGKPIVMHAMPVATDLASGMSAKRRAEVARQTKTAILGRYMDITLLFDGVAAELDLGDAFRAGPVSDVPVLVFAGTLDGRTDIVSQREALSGLKNASFVTVRNAGHNLFDQPTDEITATVDRFMRGRRIDDATLTVDLPAMAPQVP